MAQKHDFWARFTAPIGGKELAIDGFEATERFSTPFTIEVDVSSDKPIDFMPLLGTGVGLELTSSNKTADRAFHGVLFAAEAQGRARDSYSYTLTLRPWFSLLEMGANLRIFSKMTALDIIKSVFKSAGFSDYEVKGSTAGLEVREYCVQFKESDFDFVSRLMEDEGIYYYFEHTGKKHTMMLCDAPSCHTAFPTELTVMRGEDDEAEQPALTVWDRTVQPAVIKTTLWDSHFRKPGQNLEARAEEPNPKGQLPSLEMYEYPGNYGYVSDEGAQAGTRYAKVRLEEERADCDTMEGEGHVFAVPVGAKIKVKEEPGGPPTGAGEFIVIEATHTFTEQKDVASGSASDETFGFSIEIEAIPAAVSWRAPRVTEKPVTSGPQTAVVIGVSDKQIEVDEFGRVRVHFDWDRGPVADTLSASGGAPPAGGDISDNRTCWLRVTQGWADKGFGAMHIPRVGEEVLVDFLDGDPDRPIITGRVYNSKNTVPYKLPDNKTQSGWKSQTVGESGSYDGSEEQASSPGHNELRFEDKGGSEEFYIHAERIFNSLIRLDETRKTGRDTTVRVGRNRTVDIKKNETITIETGDETRTIKQGKRTTEVMGDDSLTVKTGAYSVKVNASSATIEAATQIVLKCGQSTITMTPASIEIKSVQISIQAQAMFESKAPMSQHNADAMMIIKGGMTMIN